jgi:hypothetical protein
MDVSGVFLARSRARLILNEAVLAERFLQGLQTIAQGSRVMMPDHASCSVCKASQNLDQDACLGKISLSFAALEQSKFDGSGRHEVGGMQSHNFDCCKRREVTGSINTLMFWLILV